MIKVLLLGKDGRVHCIADTLKRSAQPTQLFVVSEYDNPGLTQLAEERVLGSTSDQTFVADFARRVKPDFAIIGPEEPLAAGVIDILEDQLGIPCVGPRQALARLESSKAFTRELLQNHGIPGNPGFRVFQSLQGIREYLLALGEFVIKPDGLTAGKGVRVSGEHLVSVEDGVGYCEEVFAAGHRAVVVEEKLVGREFSLQSFSDGSHVVDLVVAQDHKRAHVGDKGPNTGGMGSYSCEDHLLPFLSRQDLELASAINRQVAEALRRETGRGFRGILYGGFMLTKQGLRVLEYNARFGDPEAMNVLPILKTDFVEICQAIVGGTLDRVQVKFEQKATVCKYVVPEGYPDSSKGLKRIEAVPEPSKNLRVYYAAVEKKPDGLYLTGSRAVAMVGIGETLADAEQIAEAAASSVRGPVFHRSDIGTFALVS